MRGRWKTGFRLSTTRNAVSISPVEQTSTITQLIVSLATNLPCDDPRCPHTLLTESEAKQRVGSVRCGPNAL